MTPEVYDLHPGLIVGPSSIEVSVLVKQGSVGFGFGSTFISNRQPRTPVCSLASGIDQHGFFRADTDFSSSANDRYADNDFLEPMFGADTAFATSIYIIKVTQ